MDRRIKTVYAVSVVTIVLMLMAQGYWLYNQYQYSAGQVMQTMMPVCKRLIHAEELKRYNGYQADLVKNGRKEETSISIMIHINRKKQGSASVNSRFIFHLPNGKSRTMSGVGMDAKDANDIVDRYRACSYQPFQQQQMDSLLMANGYEKTHDFMRLKKMKPAMEPQFTMQGRWKKELRVTYCCNPMLGEGVTFCIAIPTTGTLKLLVGQLVLSLLLIAVIACCLLFQVKTIMIQKRIDGLRHEFLKNMIFEQKQPKEKPADDDDCIQVGDTEFRYGLNELRHGNERVILTSRQAEIFRMLAERPNTVVTREQLLNEAWGDDS